MIPEKPTVLWSEERIPNFSPTLDQYHKTNAASKKTLWYSKNRVALTESVKWTGLNKNSGAQWFRWETIGSNSVTRSPKGTWIIRGATHDSRRGTHYTSGSITQLVSQPRFQEAAELAFGMPVTHATVYPLAKHYGLGDYDLAAPGVMPMMKASDLPDLVRRVFGKKRYRKDLARAVARSSPGMILVASQFRGMVPIDWLAEFLEAQSHVQFANQAWAGTPFRRMLYTLDPRSYRDLLRCGPLQRNDIYEMNEFSRGFPANLPAPVGRPRSWHEFHELAFPPVDFYYEHQKTSAYVNEPIPDTAMAKKIRSKATPPGYTFVLPADTDTLREWGNEMHNCIGSYGFYVTGKDTQTTLGGIYDGSGKLVANVEIAGKKLRQCLGKYNQSAPAVAKVFEPWFKSLGLDTNYYLGME